jgi:hypothetical protein
MNRDEAIRLLEVAETFNSTLIEPCWAVGITPRNRSTRVGTLQEEIVFECDRCKKMWPNLLVDEQMRPGYWKCPNGCNA